MPMQISVDLNRVADFCRRHHIRSLGLFGSVLRDDFDKDSGVDLNSPGFLSRSFRQSVLDETHILYAA